jgi:hypothetical protein
MKRNTGIGCVLLTAALVFTGGGGTAFAQAHADPAAPPVSSEVPPPEAGNQPFTTEELTALVASLTDAQGQPLIVVPAADLDRGAALIRELLAAATITPEECGVFATEGMQLPEGSTHAAGISPSLADNNLTTLTLFAVQDRKTMEEELDRARDAADECADFTVEMLGQTLSSRMEPLEVQTIGEESVGSLITQTFETGETQQIMTVTGTDGALAATAVTLGMSIAPEAQAELTELVNDALAAAESGAAY